MTDHAVGLDLIEIGRLARALDRRAGLAERIFTDRERSFAGARAQPARHLAARFAAKEAALKALGLGGLRLHEVEVVGGGDGPPALALHGSAAAEASRRGLVLEVSLTHSREFAAAVVLAHPAPG